MNWIKELLLSGKYVAMGNVIINQAVAKINHPVVNVLGVILLILVVIFCLLISCPSRSQYTFLRIGFSFGVTTSFLPLIGKIRYGKYNLKGLLTLSLILFSYLVNPAELNNSDPCHLNAQAEGIVLIGKKPLEDALITLPQHDFRTFSNSSGEFLIQWKEALRESDSILIKIQSKAIDTTFYWVVETVPIKVELANPIVPISKKTINDLLDERIMRFTEIMNGNYLKWKTNTVIELSELLKYYEPFEQMDTNHRNEFLFKGLSQKKTFRVNLREAGITEVEILPPYNKHEFDFCTIFILKSSPFPNYQLHYLMRNEELIRYETKLKYLSDDHYKLSVFYTENIRCIRVLLDCSKRTDGCKMRMMEVYGFLPMEEYVLEFTQGRWVLTESKST